MERNYRGELSRERRVRHECRLFARTDTFGRRLPHGAADLQVGRVAHLKVRSYIPLRGSGST